jgi:hypothetical protein
MAIASGTAGSSAARVQRYRARRQQGTRCITVHVNKSNLEALIARGHLSEGASQDPAAIKAAIEGVISDVVFEVEAERSTRNQRGKRVTTRHRDA